MKVADTSIIIGIFFIIILSACGKDEEVVPPPITVDAVQSMLEPIDPVNPQPKFTQFYSTGTTVIYSYVFLSNVDTMTGSFPVRLRWFSPNDFSPPMAQRVVELAPGQNVAQFSLHNEDGLPRGPYQLIARAGKNLSDLTASGSSRIFIGMTPEEAQQFLEEEAEVRKQRDEKRRLQEEERKKQEAQEAAMSGSTLSGSVLEQNADELPPALTSGVVEEG